MLAECGAVGGASGGSSPAPASTWGLVGASSSFCGGVAAAASILLFGLFGLPLVAATLALGLPPLGLRVDGLAFALGETFLGETLGEIL